MNNTKQKKQDKVLMVLGYLSRYGSITRHAAKSHFQIWDLHKIIYTLRKRGHEIETEGLGDDLKYTIPQIAQKYKSKPRQSENGTSTTQTTTQPK